MHTKPTITNEQLAAYAEGKLYGSERDAVRKYIADNPSELQSVMMMMDEDYDLDLDVKNDNDINFDDKLDFPIGAAGGMAGCFAAPSLCKSVAAFANNLMSNTNNVVGSVGNNKDDFMTILDNLCDEIY